MHLLVFVTDDGKGGTTGATLYLPQNAEASLPPNPRSLEWRYFATISDRDELLAHSPGAIEAIEQHGYFVTNRII